MTDLASAREHMVQEHLVRRGISHPLLLAAFRSVPREAFLEPEQVSDAYVDSPTAIGHGQTISQPYVVALTVEQLGLRGSERVLEVGTGSGYAAAILGSVAREVHTVERIPALAEIAAERLARLGFLHVHVHGGDGSLGWPEHAPYDAIAVAASGPAAPSALLAQLAIGGRLVMPIGSEADRQQLVRITRLTVEDYRREEITEVRFVPLIGDQAWAPAGDRSPQSALTCAPPTVPRPGSRRADPFAMPGRRR